jgi:hypothetical protein
MSPHSHDISVRRRFIVAGLGGITPVLLSLVVVDLETLLINVTVLAIISYAIRVLALFALGGLVGWLHRKEIDAVKLFQLGIAAPALITAAINGGRITLPQTPAIHTSHSSWSIISEAVAQPASENIKQFSLPKETPSQQVVRGLFGTLPKNVWYVIAGSTTTKEEAERKAEEARKKGFPADVYAPYGGNPCYAVVIGSQLTQSQAQELRNKAVSAGLPKDTYLWTFPQR